MRHARHVLRLAEATGPVWCSEKSLQTGSVAGGAGTAAATVRRIVFFSSRINRFSLHVLPCPIMSYHVF